MFLHLSAPKLPRMKPLTLSLILFLLLQQADGQFLSPSELQKRRQQPSQPDANYGMISLSMGTLFPLHPGQVFTSHFQYTSTSATTGASATHAFAGTSGSFYSIAILGDLLHGAYISNNSCLDLGLGLNGDMSNDVSAYIKFGYGYIFRFGRLQVQPTLDFYWALDGPVTMGTINNKDSNINILGFTAKSQFTETSSDANGNTTTDTYNAGTLEINYKRNSFLAAPKVLLGTVLGRHLYVGVEAGWLLQMWQTTTIKLTQYDENDGTNTNAVGKVHLNTNGSLGGPEVALNVGWCFGGVFKKKKGH
jgi:hypothetical protein